jgi:hypothetical protein
VLRPVVVLREGVLSAYDCVTVNRADDFPDALAVLMLSDDVIGDYRCVRLLATIPFGSRGRRRESAVCREVPHADDLGRGYGSVRPP